MTRLPPNFVHDHQRMLEREGRSDAGEVAFVERALLFVETETYNFLFPPLEGRKYIPVDNSVPPGARHTSYKQYTRTGIAKLVTGRGRDLPTTKLFVKEFFHQLYWIGCSYEYVLEDLLAAQFSATNGGPALNLDMEMAQAAREAIERGFDAIMGIGSTTSTAIPGLSVGVGPDVGLLGLLNQPNATTYTPAAGAQGSTLWSLKTPDEKLADLTGMYAAMEVATYKIFVPDTFLLPIVQYRGAAGQRMGDGSDESVISLFKKLYPGVAIDSWQYCQGAGGIGPTTGVGAAGTDRAVAYINDKRRVKMVISQEFMQQAPQYEDLEFSVDCLGRTAGVFSQYPISILYADSI